jgi:protein SCO1
MRHCWHDLLAACAALLTAVAAAEGGREQVAVRTSQAAIGRDAGAWEMVDQRGQPVRFDTLSDRPLVVSFIYTGCFQVCFNQPFDGPEALADFARRQHVDDPQWLFVAPREGDVPALLQRFGLTVERTAAGFDHLVQASIVDRHGVIVRQIYGDQFDLPLFIEPLKQLAAGEAARGSSVGDIWTKVRLYCTVYDPYTGKYRLDYSLFFEMFAGVTTLGTVGWFLLRNLRRRS